jgi:hypothetical protein
MREIDAGFTAATGSIRVTGQADARGEAHRVDILPGISPSRLVSDRPMAGNSENREDHEHGKQSQRETATHRLRSCLEIAGTIKRPSDSTMNVRLRLHEKSENRHFHSSHAS